MICTRCKEEIPPNHAYDVRDGKMCGPCMADEIWDLRKERDEACAELAKIEIKSEELHWWEVHSKGMAKVADRCRESEKQARAELAALRRDRDEHKAEMIKACDELHALRRQVAEDPVRRVLVLGYTVARAIGGHFAVWGSGNKPRGRGPTPEAAARAALEAIEEK